MARAVSSLKAGEGLKFFSYISSQTSSKIRKFAQILHKQIKKLPIFARIRAKIGMFGLFTPEARANFTFFIGTRLNFKVLGGKI